MGRVPAIRIAVVIAGGGPAPIGRCQVCLGNAYFGRRSPEHDIVGFLCDSALVLDFHNLLCPDFIVIDQSDLELV